MTKEEQQRFLHTLKTFAFKQSKAFCDDRLAEIDITKSMVHRDPELNQRDDFIKTSLGFVATRLYPTEHWPELNYQFIATTETESSLDSIPEAIMAEYTDEYTTPEDLYDPDVDSLTQTLSTSYTVDTVDPDDIITLTTCSIRCNDSLVWEKDTSSFNNPEFERIVTPRIESLTGADKDDMDQMISLYYPRPIEHERFDDIEHGLVAIAFEQVVGTLSRDDTPLELHDYRDNARQMLHIINQIRNY